VSALHVAFVVLDPAQDYDEDSVIWSVHGSLEAAKVGARQGRAREYAGSNDFQERIRHTEVQRWQGARCTDVWTFWPGDRTWDHRPGPGSSVQDPEHAEGRS
jgi:hypothetical protein